MMTPCEYDALRVKQDPPKTLHLERLIKKTDDTPRPEPPPVKHSHVKLLDQWKESRRWYG